MTASPLLELRDVTVSFPGTVALDEVSIRLYPGEVHALMGENGAGKSTVINALNGVKPIASGRITLDGEDITIDSPAESRDAGIATVFQDIHLGPLLSVVENVMLGYETRGRLGIDWRTTRRRAARVLDDLGLGDLDLRTRLKNLSPAEQQLVAIARAMVGSPRVVLLDEPTSSLEASDVGRLFSVIRRMRDQGVAIVFVSHFLEQVFAISDRMTVLRDGRVVGEHLTRDMDRVELISLMLGRDVEALRSLGSERRAHRQEPEGPPVLVAEDLEQRGVVEPTNLTLFRGEIVGVAGLRGSGRTELARLLAGVAHADGGTLEINGRRVQLDGPSSGLRHRVVLSSEDRAEDGVVRGLTLLDNIILSLQAIRGWRHPVTPRERAEIDAWSREAFGLEDIAPGTPAEHLSGGTQQKMLLARLLAARPLVVILDEPTRGIDIATKLEIQRRIAQVADQGMSVVFISSELSEVVRLSDRIVVLKDREKIGELSNGPGVTVDTVVEMIAADGVTD